MIHTILRFALLSVFLLAVPLHAQDAFVVMSVKGKVEYAVKAQPKKWQPLVVGQTLHTGDVVKTSFSSYAKLMVNGRRLVSVDQNALRPVATLVAKKSGNGSAAEEILSYAATQVTRAKSEKGGTTFGAVRGEIPLFSAVFPKSAAMSTTPVFQWLDQDSAASYELLILDDHYAPVDTRKLTSTSFTYDAASTKLSPRREYHWRVTRMTDGLASDVQSFRILDTDTVALIRGELAKLDKSLTAMNADEVTTHLIRAIYLERKQLYADAFAEYRTTIRLAPGVEEYREMLRTMLATAHLVIEEELLLR